LVYNNFIYPQIWTQGFGFAKTLCCSVLYYKTFFRNGFTLVLFSQTKRFYIMKTFQNNWFYYSYPYYSGSSILYFVSTPLPEGQQGAKAEALITNSSSHQSNSLGSTAAVSFSFRGNHHYLWDKKT
jgi:hypothetical protein